MRTARAKPSPLPPLTLAATFAAALLLGCGGTRHETVDVPPPAGDSSYDIPANDSQAARTQAMEQQAADMQQGYEDAKNDPDASAEEKIKAYQEFEQQRQDLNKTGEGEGDDDSGGGENEP